MRNDIKRASLSSCSEYEEALGDYEEGRGRGGVYGESVENEVRGSLAGRQQTSDDI